jgi:uncharacterized protein YqeY
MPILKETINNDLKQAMKEKKQGVLLVLRMLLSALKDKEIALRKGEEINLTEEQVIEVIASEIKKRKDSVLAYEQGGRSDLARTEKDEILILEKYLPPQLSDEELEKIVKEEIASFGEAGLKDMGKIIGRIMPRVKGKADGGRVSEMVKKILV